MASVCATGISASRHLLSSLGTAVRCDDGNEGGDSDRGKRDLRYSAIDLRRAASRPQRDPTQLSGSALDRLATAEAMTLVDYGVAITRRQRIREVHSRLDAHYDAAITLAAPGAAPVGLGSTGNPVFNVPASLLGISALSLPMLVSDGLPLGLQVMGFTQEDAHLFAIAAAIRDRSFARRRLIQ